MIGDLCDIGSNAVLIPRVVLPPGGIVGAGAVVTRSPELPADCISYTLVGCPAKVIKVNTPRLIVAFADFQAVFHDHPNRTYKTCRRS